MIHFHSRGLKFFSFTQSKPIISVSSQLIHCFSVYTNSFSPPPQVIRRGCVLVAKGDFSPFLFAMGEIT